MGAPTATSTPLDEASARRLLLVRACEGAEVPDALWSPEDRAWATRLAVQTVPADAAPARFLDERARHAIERLLPRDASLAPLLNLRLWRPAWAALALLLGLLLGLVADSLGSDSRINLLAPPVWALVLWNLCVYLLITWHALRPAPVGLALPGWLRRLLLRLPALRRVAGGPLAAWSTQWLAATAPRHAARAAQLLHLAAAGLALGLMLGLYLRGLVWDYRAGWQSTFLEPAAVQTLLSSLLAPASALTGIGLPGLAEVAALRVTAATPATASAAPWIHLYAATLLLAVVLPRLLLALWAAWRGARPVSLDLSDPYYQRLLVAWRGKSAHVQVLPHGAAPSPQALEGLQQLLGAALGPGLELHVAAATAHGDEDTVAAADAGTTLRLLLVDLASTPEAEIHGLWIDNARQAGLPLLLLADETTFSRRFGALPQRLRERRDAWQALAGHHGVSWVGVSLGQPEAPQALAALEAALKR